MPLISPLRSFLIFASTIALGFIAGFFYTYEVSVMRGFAYLNDAEFIAAMRSVNATIRNWAFAPSFFGSALLAILTALLHIRHWRHPKSLLIIGSTLLYTIGALLLTMRINVPMNEWLAAQGPAALMPNPGAIRVQYEQDWVFWNLVRTIHAGLAFAMMAVALWLDGRERASA
jgi:uncharacterized membrane protein